MVQNKICAAAPQTIARAGFRFRSGQGTFFCLPRRPRLLVAVALSLAIGTCACTKKVTVPNVVQQDVEQAKQMLASAQLKPGSITSAQGTVPPGSYVLLQTPQAGQQVPANSDVDLVAEAPATVPDLTKSSVTDAMNTLQGLGLKAAFVKQSSLNVFGGAKVVAQTPTGGTVVRRGSMVTLTVTTTPDLDAAFGLVSKEPAYSQLNAEYRKVLDELFGKQEGSGAPQ
jgi:beta-lactam-binding protein with PASTA domain